MLTQADMSHPMRVRGLKPHRDVRAPGPVLVAPYAGAWIETMTCGTSAGRSPSRTLCGCVD